MLDICPMSVLMYGANVWTLKNSISKLHSFEKFELFGHICRMNDDRLIKSITFGVMNGTSKNGRPRRRWTDDLEELEEDWCYTDLYTHSQ